MVEVTEISIVEIERILKKKGDPYRNGNGPRFCSGLRTDSSVNSVNQSTNFGAQPLTRSGGFYAPCLSEIPRVPSGLPIHRANALVNSSSPGSPVHLFTKLGTFPLTRSRGFPTPYQTKIRRGPHYLARIKSMSICLRWRGNSNGVRGCANKPCYGCYARYIEI